MSVNLVLWRLSFLVPFPSACQQMSKKLHKVALIAKIKILNTVLLEEKHIFYQFYT